MKNDFCPFVNGICKKDCVFYTHSTSISGEKYVPCLIAIKLSDIPETKDKDKSTHNDMK